MCRVHYLPATLYQSPIDALPDDLVQDCLEFLFPQGACLIKISTKLQELVIFIPVTVPVLDKNVKLVKRRRFYVLTPVS